MPLTFIQGHDTLVSSPAFSLLSWVFACVPKMRRKPRTCSSVVETYHRVVHNSPCTSMKLPFYTHLPLRLSWPLGMNSGHLPSLLTICVCSQALKDALGDNITDQKPPESRS
ncbi:hypothetical protein IGI04_007008 [Brassica rapa subsp. trilocularis]|uniref:Uncharacterized protein n=1 Tax=Brassica rapa subsp. trilocularis TaxID=1813537 RepID=A0ABQ7NIK2_BRACM|nr:hypothetical protein IGI04_007008 [Brassica rapa subsp. trilocularis]